MFSDFQIWYFENFEMVLQEIYIYKSRNSDMLCKGGLLQLVSEQTLLGDSGIIRDYWFRDLEYFWLLINKIIFE